LINILEYYLKRNKSNIYSIKHSKKINDSVNLLAKNPLLGTRTQYHSVRALVRGDYHIIYEVFDQLILIIMIWDCRRNPEEKTIQQRIKNKPE